ncbi:MAG: hypothetical protein SNJ78_03340 [Spirochaetales bacterium]
MYIPLERTFNAQTLTGSWVSVRGHLLYTGDQCLVYIAEDEQNKIPQVEKVAGQIGKEFDEKVYPVVKEYFGEPYDVDRNGKVILLLLDIQDGYDPQTNNAYVAGYFDQTHMLSLSNSRYSNEADMLFLDTYPGLRKLSGEIDTVALQDLKITMAHELQHLVNYSEKVIRQKASPMDTWINEGLSAAAEYLYLGRHVDWKIDYFNQVQYQITVSQSYNPLKDENLWGQYFVSWGRWGNPLVNYSTVYLFFQWLRIQAGIPLIYREILQDIYSDYRAVVNAFVKYVPDVPTEFMGEGWNWKHIFRTWLLANLLNQSTGLYGYKHKLTDSDGNIRYVYPRYFTALSPSNLYPRGSFPPIDTQGKANLLAGDAVYVLLNQQKYFGETEVLAYAGVPLNDPAPHVSLGTGNYENSTVFLALNTKGIFDGYVFQTPALIMISEQTQVAITNLTPPGPQGGLVSKSISGVGGRVHRPHPIDALLGLEPFSLNERAFVLPKSP